MKTNKKTQPIARMSKTTAGGHMLQPQTRTDRSKTKDTGERHSQGVGKKRTLAKVIMPETLFATIVRTVDMVRDKYPQAIFEWPDQLCSISEYPGGPEVSRRYAHGSAAWIDAARTINQRNKQRVMRRTHRGDSASNTEFLKAA